MVSNTCAITPQEVDLIADLAEADGCARSFWAIILVSYVVARRSNRLNRKIHVSPKVKFERVLTVEQVEIVVKLADVIWTEHYAPMIGKAQVEYMLNNFHSIDSIRNEVNNKSIHYYLIYKAETVVGYAGMKIEEWQLFLSKIYILSSERGNGIGKETIELVKEIAISNGLGKVYLTVNKKNTKTIGAYQKIGFNITGEVCADIGEGHVMDDYEMELVL
jgi:GNAT superfamily N-acetyltransferase